MKKSKFSEEQIVKILAEAAKPDKTVTAVCRAHGVSENTYYVWRRKYAGLETEDLRRLRGLERENAQLKRIVIAGPGVGYRQAWARGRKEFGHLGPNRVHRVWKQEGLSLKKRRTRKFKTGRTVPTKSERPNHVWCPDFCFDYALNGTKLKILAILDEHTRECLDLTIATSLTAKTVGQILEGLFATLERRSFFAATTGRSSFARPSGSPLRPTAARASSSSPDLPGRWARRIIQLAHEGGVPGRGGVRQPGGRADQDRPVAAVLQ